MIKKWIFPLSFALLLTGFAPLFGQGIFLQKDIHVAADEIRETIISFGGTITVQGEVEKNVIAFGGKVVIEGKVGELVLGFGSEIELRPTAVIKGDVVCLGGKLLKEPETHIKGDVIYFELNDSKDIKRFFSDGLGGLLGLSLMPFFLIIKLLSLFVWLIFALVLAGIFPRQITYASSQIRTRFGSVFGVGILSIMAFSVLVVFAAILSLILIGIPLFFALVILGYIIKVFGRIILFYFLGESLLKILGKEQAAPIPATLVGFLLVGFIGFIPIIGSLVTLVLSIIGWGVVILTKFGTRENWFKKKS